MHEWTRPLMRRLQRRQQLEAAHKAMVDGLRVQIMCATAESAKVFLDAYTERYPGEPLPPVETIE